MSFAIIDIQRQISTRGTLWKTEKKDDLYDDLGKNVDS